MEVLAITLKTHETKGLDTYSKKFSIIVFVPILSNPSPKIAFLFFGWISKGNMIKGWNTQI